MLTLEAIWLRRLSAAAIMAVATFGPAFAWQLDAPTQRRAAPEPGIGPVVYAILDLWEGIDKSGQTASGPCRPSNTPIQVSVKPFDDQSSGVTDGQKKGLLFQIIANISHRPNVSFVSYEAKRTAKNLTHEEMLHEVNFVVTPVIIKESNASLRVYRFYLRAENSNPDCSVSSGVVALEESDVTEQILPPDTMFNTISQQLIEVEKGDVRIIVRQPRFDNILADDDQWETIVNALQRSLQAARERRREQFVTPTLQQVAVVRPPQGGEGGSPDYWIADVRLSPKVPNLLRTDISISDARNRKMSDLVYVDPEPFAVRSAALARQDPMGSGPESILPFSERPHYIRDILQSGARPQRLAVDVTGQSALELDLKSVSGGPIGMTLTFENGQVVSPAELLPSRPGLARYSLRPGRYVVGLTPPMSGAADYLLRVRGSKGTLGGEPNGTVVQTVGDWTVGVYDGQAGRECFAATQPVELSPDTGWRPAGPVFQFRVGYRSVPPTSDDLNMLQVFDQGRFYDAARAMRAELVLADGQRESLPLGEDSGGRIGTFKTCPGVRGGACFNQDAIWKMSRAQKLILTGVARKPDGRPDGRPTRIIYSLRGYTAAMNALSATCNDWRVADRLIPPR